MKLKANYFIIPGYTLFIALLGKWFNPQGMAWYVEIKSPGITPPKWAFPVAWNIIFACAMVSALIIWN